MTRPVTFFNYFGGPLDLKFTGVRHGPAPLHRVFTISDRSIPALAEYSISSIPLIYGMQYSGCQLTYRLPRGSICNITKFKPRRSSKGWPYDHYPNLLPYIPMHISKRTRCSPKQFAKLAWQGLDIKPEMLVAIVPPLPIGGVSIWGPIGDVEGVQIIFECDLKTRTVRASNQCS